MADNRRRSDMDWARLIFVISCFAPLFVLWALQGTPLIPDVWFASVLVVGLALAPTAFLYARLRVARKRRDKVPLSVGSVEDHRDHILVYLFAMLLPFYAPHFTTWREFAAAVVALLFIVFLFWHLDFHYMNLLFAFRGYRVYSVYPPDGNRLSGVEPTVLLTRRTGLRPGVQIDAYRISRSVYVEMTT